jgi:hypothetical protein
VLANDGTGVPTNGCEPFINALDVSGNIAFVDRGGCPFVVKVKNAQNAGALAVVVADSVPGCPALGMSGVDPTITIPSVRITNDDGATIKSHLLLGVNATLQVDPALRAGADAAGRVLVYTPIPFATGSSVSHWDTSPTPNLLMEPAINPDLSSNVDLALHHFIDIGWVVNATSSTDNPEAASTRLGNYPNPFRASTRIRFSLEREETVDLGVYDLAGRLVKRLASGRLTAGHHAITWDGTDVTGRRTAAGIYHYSLRTASATENGRMVLVR